MQFKSNKLNPSGVKTQVQVDGFMSSCGVLLFNEHLSINGFQAAKKSQGTQSVGISNSYITSHSLDWTRETLQLCHYIICTKTWDMVICCTQAVILIKCISGTVLEHKKFLLRLYSRPRRMLMSRFPLITVQPLRDWAASKESMTFSSHTLSHRPSHAVQDMLDTAADREETEHVLELKYHSTCLSDISYSPLTYSILCQLWLEHMKWQWENM